MNYDHVFPKADIISLILARFIQLRTSDSILLLHPDAEIGMPTTSCGIFSSKDILNQLNLEPFPNSLNISSNSLRSEWFEKHLAIILANNGAYISTRATFNQTSPTSGKITGSTSISGEIKFNYLHNISIPESHSHSWYCKIHMKNPPPDITFFSKRSDNSFESWSKNDIVIPNTFETRIGMGSSLSPNTIDIIMELAQEYLDHHLNTN